MCRDEHSESVCPACLAEVRDDLSALPALWRALPGQSVSGSERGRLVAAAPIPGGDATVILAPFTRDIPQGERVTVEHPLQILQLWADAWREWFGHEIPARSSAAESVRYLDEHLTEIARAKPHEGRRPPKFRSFGRYVHRARLRLENVLHAGDRAEQTPTPCLDCSARLTFVYDDDPADDRYECPRPSCRRRYTPAEYARAKAQLLHESGADRFVPISEAVAASGRTEHTIRTWIKAQRVTTACDVSTHRLLVWWPDVREQSTLAQRR